jgi:hypothetical protein
MSFDMCVRLETGLYELRSSRSRDEPFSNGVICAFFKFDGKTPVERDLFISTVRIGKSLDHTDE